jgi:hypothetical protein
VLLGSVGLTVATGLAAAPAATAGPAHVPARHHGVSSALGATTVTTAPGIAQTLLNAGILPLPVLPRTGFGVFQHNGLQVSYTFPITRNSASLATGTGDINHAGGVWFVGRHASLEVGRFDIDLAAGKVFATQLNFAPARVAVLDLDLSALTVGSRPDGSTVLSGIAVKLDPAGAAALNKTFGITLPTDGSLVFGSARVVLC